MIGRDRERSRSPWRHLGIARTKGENGQEVRRKVRLLPLVDPDHDKGRPKTRGECVAGPRPCPWVGCRYHLYLETNGEGVRYNFPGLEVDELPETCALDVADLGGVTLETVGEILNVTRERIRQVEFKAGRRLNAPHLRALWEDE